MTCANCGASIAPDNAIYDDREHIYHCDRACFHEWADAHFDEVTAFYERLNIQ